MKLTNVEIYADGNPTPINLNFKDPMGVEPYTIKSILGLDAEDIVPQFSGMLDVNTKFYNLTLQPRTMVIKVGLNPDFSMNLSNSDLRDNLYRLISSSRKGKLRFLFKNKDEEIADIYGFLTKFESPLFEQTQEIQLTIFCENPMLKSPDQIIYPMVGLDPANSLIEDIKSTAPHGVLMFLDIKKNISRVRIYDPLYPDDWEFVVDPVLGFQNGDLFVFSSDPALRFVQYSRSSGPFVNVADSIQSGSTWPIIFPGENHFAFEDPTGFQWRSIVWNSTYWGV